MTKSPANNHPILSVIILNYKTYTYTANCLKSIFDSNLGQYLVEVIVVDNNSADGSFEKISKIKSTHSQVILKFLGLKENLGFAKGNNRGVAISDPKSKFVLFLNSDTIVESDTLKKSIDFFTAYPDAAANTCNVILKLTGHTQPECHRGFPTPWNTFWHFYGFGIPKLFPKTAAFHGYLNDHLDFTKVQRIDCFVGAYIMIRRSAGEDIGWWNEKYFFYGEDLDFAYKLHQKGYKVYFNPDCKTYHFQGISSGFIDKTTADSKASRDTKVKVAKASTDAMITFVKDNLIDKYPTPLKWLVLTGISLLAFKRYIKARYK